jgi:MraZ protein
MEGIDWNLVRNAKEKMYFGKCTLPVSEKNQLALPSDFRETGSNAVFLTQGFDRNLMLLSPHAFSKMASHIQAASISDPLARLMNRLFMGSATELVIDAVGNIDLPMQLREYAELGREIVIVGQGEYSEIWSPALWQKQMDSVNDFEANTHRFEKFNISLA